MDSEQAVSVSRAASCPDGETRAVKSAPRDPFNLLRSVRRPDVTRDPFNLLRGKPAQRAAEQPAQRAAELEGKCEETAEDYASSATDDPDATLPMSNKGSRDDDASDASTRMDGESDQSDHEPGLDAREVADRLITCEGSHGLGLVAPEVVDCLAFTDSHARHQLEERSGHELDGCVSEVHHDRLIAPVPTGQVDDHERGAVASKVHHDRLVPLDEGVALPEGHERGAVASKVHHDRLTLWLTDEQIEEEKARSRKPWQHLGGHLGLYNTDDIDPEYGDHEYLVDVFLQSTFFRARSNKKIGSERLKKKWANFVNRVEYVINSLDEDRRKYEDSAQGHNFKLHHMCLRERIPCAATRCKVCGPDSRRFMKSMVWHPEFNQLSQELRDLIAGADDEIAKTMREAAAEAKEVAKIEEKPVVKFVMKYMDAAMADVNEWVAEVQNTYSNAVEVEESLNILRGEVEELQHDMTNNQVSRDEEIEKAVAKEVGDAMEDVHSTIDEEVKDAVNAKIRRVVNMSARVTNAKIRRLGQKMDSYIARQEEVRRQQEATFEEMKARQEAAMKTLEEMKAIVCEFVKSKQ